MVLVDQIRSKKILLTSRARLNFGIPVKVLTREALAREALDAPVLSHAKAALSRDSPKTTYGTARKIRRRFSTWEMRLSHLPYTLMQKSLHDLGCCSRM